MNVVDLLKKNRRAKRQWKHNVNLNYWTWSSKIKHPASPSAKRWQSTLTPHLFKVGSCIPTSSWYIVTPQATIIHFYKHGSFIQGTFVPLGSWRPEESNRRVSGACLILETPGENVCIASFSAGACPQSLADGYISPLCLSRQIASFSFASSPCVSPCNLYLLLLRKYGNTLGNSENPK